QYADSGDYRRDGSPQRRAAQAVDPVEMYNMSKLDQAHSGIFNRDEDEHKDQDIAERRAGSRTVADLTGHESCRAFTPERSRVDAEHQGENRGCHPQHAAT